MDIIGRLFPDKKQIKIYVVSWYLFSNIADFFKCLYDVCLVWSFKNATRVQLVCSPSVDWCDCIQLGNCFFEYCLQVPANRLGFKDSGGPFDIMQLKVIQEVITLAVFTLFSVWAFKTELKWNHLAAFLCLVLAVYFVFKK